MNPLLVDSGYFIALFNPRDQYHQQALGFAQSLVTPIVVPEVVLVEVAYMLHARIGRAGAMQVIHYVINERPDLAYLNLDDLERVYAIQEQYPQYDFVDSCVMALAERLAISQILTFDRRHFSTFRPQHCDYLELLP